MAKVRACMREGCPHPAMKGKRRCGWHWLASESAEVQADAARRRAARVLPEAHRARVPKKEWPEGGRWCAGCQSIVPLWYCSGSRCKACASVASHGSSIEKRYGITREDYTRLLVAQKGRCAICRNKPRTLRLAVDHDHETGQVRGLLCSGEKGCNHGLLGAAKDDVEVLRRAVTYLDDPPAPRILGR